MTRLLGILGALAVLLVGWLVLIRDPGPDPLLDANRQPLAESPAEGYCGGVTFWHSQGRGNIEEMNECLDQSNHPTERDWTQVQEMFCRGMVSAGWSGTAGLCVTIMQDFRYWPTLTGTITDSWNRSFPYPGNLIDSPAQDQSRTGDRIEENLRPEGDR